MSQPDIKAEKINSPIQLMAAWFVMLILLSGVLLTAAVEIKKPEWAAGYLVISTTILILIVIGTVILMLTKFRPHLQEGKEYAEWLKEQNRYSEGVIKDDSQNNFVSSIKSTMDLLKKKVKSEEEVNILNELEDEIIYTVMVSNIEGVDSIIAGFKELDVEVELNNVHGDKTIESHQAIWLGSNIPAEYAVPIIKKAVEIWPHLKYIGFSSEEGPDYTHWQIYIGGATSTALDRGYKPWTNDEIANLEVKDTALFHRDIRKKLP